VVIPPEASLLEEFAVESKSQEQGRESKQYPDDGVQLRAEVLGCRHFEGHRGVEEDIAYVNERWEHLRTNNNEGQAHEQDLPRSNAPAPL
jgi:hypothetical protein